MISAGPVPVLYAMDDVAGPSRPRTSEEINEAAARRRLFNHMEIWGCPLRPDECETAVSACKRRAQKAWRGMLAMHPESGAEVEQQYAHALMVAVHTEIPRLGPAPSRERNAYSSSDEHDDDPDAGFTLVGGRTRHRKPQTTSKQRQSARLDDRRPPKEWWKASSTAQAAPTIRPKPRSGSSTEQYSSGSDEDSASRTQQRHNSGAGRSGSRRGTP